MAERAQPNDIKRLRVVRMMSVYLARLSTLRTGFGANKRTSLEGFTNHPVSASLQWVGFLPLRNEIGKVLRSVLSKSFASLSSKLSDSFSVFVAVGSIPLAYFVAMGFAVVLHLLFNFSFLAVVVGAVVGGASLFVFDGHEGSVSHSQQNVLDLTGDYFA
jgi:hypothetical protein